ncbi:hypothetical protein IWX48DRAFT_594045 [Phyllosticta citricarpa]
MKAEGALKRHGQACKCHVGECNGVGWSWKKGGLVETKTRRRVLGCSFSRWTTWTGTGLRMVCQASRGKRRYGGRKSVLMENWAHGPLPLPACDPSQVNKPTQHQHANHNTVSSLSTPSSSSYLAAVSLADPLPRRLRHHPGSCSCFNHCAVSARFAGGNDPSATPVDPVNPVLILLRCFQEATDCRHHSISEQESHLLHAGRHSQLNHPPYPDK